MTFTQSTAQKVQQQLPPQALEKEFVYNLQQQVYFLELQGKLLREKMTESKQQKSRGVEANPLFDAQLDESLPLTQLFERLKLQFAQQVKESKDQIEKLKKEIDEKQLTVNEQKVKIDELSIFKENFQKILDDKKQKLEDIIAQQQLDNENILQELEKQKITAKLQEEQLNDNKKTIKDQSEKVYEQNQAVKDLQNQLNQQKTNVLATDQLQSQLSKIEFEFQQLQSKYQILSNENLQTKANLTNTQNENFNLQTQYGVAQMEVSKLENMNKMLQNELTGYAKQLASARTKGEQTELDNKQLKEKLAQIQQFQFDMKQVIESFNNKRKIDQLNEQIQQLKNDNAVQVNNNKVLDASLKQSEITISNLQNQVSKLNDKINADQQSLTQKQANYNTIVLLNSSQADEISKLKLNEIEDQDYIEKLLAKIDFLQSELSMKQELSNIQLEEFENLRKSNTSLAEMLSNINTKFTNLGKAGERYVNTEKKEIDQDKRVARAAYHDRVSSAEKQKKD